MTLQDVYERHYGAESTHQMRAANLLSDLRAWCKVNGCCIDQIILDAATSISFPLGTSNPTPAIMWVDEDVVLPDDPIPMPRCVQRRAAVVDSILDSYGQDRRVALDAIVIDVLYAFLHRPPEFYDCANAADRIYDQLLEKN